MHTSRTKPKRVRKTVFKDGENNGMSLGRVALAGGRHGIEHRTHTFIFLSHDFQLL